MSFLCMLLRMHVGLAKAISHLGGGLRPPLIKRPPNSNNILYNIIEYPIKKLYSLKKNFLILNVFSHMKLISILIA